MRGSRKGVRSRGLIVDTNILLLFLVGSLDLNLISAADPPVAATRAIQRIWKAGVEIDRLIPAAHPAH